MLTKPMPDHPYHNKSDAALHYIISDATRAAEAMRGHDFVAECKYLDQVNDACTVLHYRRELARASYWRIRRNVCSSPVSHAELRRRNASVLASIHATNPEGN